MIKVMLSDAKTVSIDCYLWDPNLTYRAKGMLGLLLTLPEHLQVSEELLEDGYSKEGKAVVQSALKELIGKGYIIRNQLRNENGKLDEMVYIIYPETMQGYKRQLNANEVR